MQLDGQVSRNLSHSSVQFGFECWYDLVCVHWVSSLTSEKLPKLLIQSYSDQFPQIRSLLTPTRRQHTPAHRPMKTVCSQPRSSLIAGGQLLARQARQAVKVKHPIKQVRHIYMLINSSLFVLLRKMFFTQ